MESVAHENGGKQFRNRIATLVEQGCDLTIRQLYILFECHARGTARIRDLVTVELSPPIVSRSVSRLCDLGYAAYAEHPTDRRGKLVALTNPGREFVESVLK